MLSLAASNACDDSTIAAPCQTDGDCGDAELCANQGCVKRPQIIMLDSNNTGDALFLRDAAEADRVSANDAAVLDLLHADQTQASDRARNTDVAIRLDSSPGSDSALGADTHQTVDAMSLEDARIESDVDPYIEDAGPFDQRPADTLSSPDAWSADSSGKDAGPFDQRPPDTFASTDTLGADGSPADSGLPDGQCRLDSDCPTGLCDLRDHVCRSVECLYDVHCSGYDNNHCSEGRVCVSAHDCSTEMGSIPYPWDDSMSVTVEGNTSDADSRFSPTGSCGSAGGPEDIFSLRLPRSVQKVTVQMSALPNPDSWDTHVYVAASICGSTNLGCEDWAVPLQPEILILTNPTDGVVTIVADGYSSNSSGPYRLTVTIDECNAASDCGAQEQCLAPATDHSRCVQP